MDPSVACGCGRLDTFAGSPAIGEVAGVLERLWCRHAHVPDLVRSQVGLAVSEITSNIIKHASRGEPVRIQMEIVVDPTEVRVEFTDDGVPADVDLDSVAMPDESAESGRGLALAKAVLDRLSYRRNTVNHWTLVSKRFA